MNQPVNGQQPGPSYNPNNQTVASGGGGGPSPCNQQVTIPPELPTILKQFAKGAMKTQPPDLLSWSGSYFRALSNGAPLPVKDRIESPVKESKDGLTPGILRVLDIQLGGKTGQRVATKEVFRHWKGFGMNLDGLNEIFQRAGMSQDQYVDWDKLMSVMACTISQNLTEVMAVICEVLTEQPEGIEPVIPYAAWFELFKYVGMNVLQVVTPDAAASVNNCLAPIANNNHGLIGPKDFTQICSLSA